MAGEFDFLNFLGVKPPDPNDPFALPAPSTSEIIARLAANLTPLAPFIGGTRTPLGRTLGAGAVLGGGAGQTVANILAQQRLDPLKRQMAIAQHIAQAGTQPTPGAPSMNLAPFAGPATSIPEGSTFELAGAGAFPAVPGPAGPPRFDPANLPIELQLAGGKIFPSLDPMKQEEVARIREQANRARFITGAPGAAILDISGETPTVAYQVPDTAQSLATNLPNKIALALSTDAEGNVDYRKAEEVLQRLRTNPQGAEGRIFDYLVEREKTGQIDPAMERTILSYQGTIRGISQERATGSERGRINERQTPQAAAAAANVAAGAAGGTVSGRTRAEEGVPLNERASQFVHPATLEFAPVDMTANEAKRAGFVTTPKNISAAIPSARMALQTMDKYEELAKKLLVSAGKGTASDIAAIQANRLSLYTRLKAGDPDVAEFASLSATLPTQVKAFGDTGNIAIKEQEFQGRALPNNEDSLESALRKIKSRRELLRSVIKSSLTGQARSAGPGLAPPPTKTPAVDPAVQEYLDSLQRRR